LPQGRFVSRSRCPAIKIGNNALVGFGFFPEDDQAELNVTIESPPGSNIEYTRIKADEVTRQIRSTRKCATRTRRSGWPDRRRGRGKDLCQAHAQGDRNISVEGHLRAASR
jgi:multidrug efflux pump subunit AcrB